MYAVSAHQFLYLPILGKQRYWRNRLVRQHTFQIFRQGKTGTFDLGGSILGALLGLLHKPLHGGLHGSKHQCRRGQPHHFQRTNGLMQLLPRNAQLAGINGGQIRADGGLRIPDKSFERLGRTIE